MKYWHIYFNKHEGRYKLQLNDKPIFELALVIFTSFNMAYDYVNRMNNSNVQSYSRWTR